MPMEPPDGEMIAVLMPTISPSMLNSGPPELPRLIAASVWMKSSNGPALMFLLRAETTPTVTEPPSPNGLPIAITQSPTRSFSESPKVTALSGCSGFTRKIAMSVLVSRPMISALSFMPLLKLAKISSASPITWLLVTMMPLGSTTTPEPSEDTRRGWLRGSSPRRLKNSSKNSSNGEPGGSCGVCCAGGVVRLRAVSIFCEVEMLTTASITRSATSATESGPLPGAPITRPGSATIPIASENAAARMSDAFGRRKTCTDMGIPLGIGDR